MKELAFFIVAIFCFLLTGCGHAQWTPVKDSTYLAGWVNPVGFAVHMVATVGELATRPTSNTATTKEAETKQ